MLWRDVPPKAHSYAAPRGWHTSAYNTRSVSTWVCPRSHHLAAVLNKNPSGTERLFKHRQQRNWVLIDECSNNPFVCNQKLNDSKIPSRKVILHRDYYKAIHIT